MIKSDSETVQDWVRLETDKMKQIDDVLRSYERDIRDYLIDIVASVCDIDTERMKDGKEMHYVRARWLFWYAYRYMTNDTFEQIRQMSRKAGMRQADATINASVNKMSELITSNTIWTKRWMVIRHVIKMRGRVNEFYFGQQQTLPTDRIYINVPRELKEKVEIKYDD